MSHIGFLKKDIRGVRSAFLIKEREVLEELNKIEGMEEAYMVYGVYDIVAKVKAENMDGLKEIVSGHVRGINLLNSTLTLVAVESQPR